MEVQQTMTEDQLEQETLGWLADTGYIVRKKQHDMYKKTDFLYMSSATCIKKPIFFTDDGGLS